MGLFATFVWTSGPALQTLDIDADLPGTRLRIDVADSEFCTLRAVSADGDGWKWAFGEPLPEVEDALRRDGYVGADPVGVADSIGAWSVEVGLETPVPARVLEALAGGDLVVEDSVERLLTVLGLRLPEAGVSPPGAPPTAAVVGSRVPATDGFTALALDHRSPAWLMLDAEHLGGSMGEPPCLVGRAGAWYLATDPPVYLGHLMGLDPREMFGVVDPVVDIPPDRSGSVLDAAAWARAHVGTPGQPPRADRPLIDAEVDLLPDSYNASAQVFYSLAPNPHARSGSGWTATSRRPSWATWPGWSTTRSSRRSSPSNPGASPSVSDRARRPTALRSPRSRGTPGAAFAPSAPPLRRSPRSPDASSEARTSGSRST